MPHPQLRRLATAAAAVTAIAATTGFSFIKPADDPTATQQTPLSPIRFAQLGCVPGAKWLDGTPNTSPCGPFSAMFVSGPGATVAFTSPGKYRLLVAYALPIGFTPPTIHMSDNPDVTFAVDPNVVTDQLAELGGAGQWVGYRSSVITMPVGAANAGGLFYADVPVPQVDGAPSALVRGTAVAIGAQVIADGTGNTYPADRAVDCDEYLDPTVPSYITSTSCPSGSGQWTETIPTDADVVAPSTAPTIDAGASATLSFRVRQVGWAVRDEQAPPIALDATSTLAGAAATPERTTLDWALAPQPPRQSAGAARPGSQRRPDSAARTTEVPVTVRVPADAATGDYDVTLRGSDAGGERAGTARIHVVGAPVAPKPDQTVTPPATVPPAVTPAPPAPAPAPAPAGRAARVQLVHRITVGTSRLLHAGRVTCRTSAACRVASVVEIGGRRVATSSVTVAPHTSQRVRLRLAPSAYRRLRQRTGTIRVTATSPNAPTVTRTLKFRTR